MKNSNIAWIGEIPHDWEIRKNKFISFMKSGSTITSEQIKESGEYPVYGGNGLRGYATEFTNSGTHILIGRQGALCGNVRLVNGTFWASEHAIVVYPYQDALHEYYFYLLLSANLNQYSTSAAQPGLAVEQIANLSFPLPPLETQQKIANFLDSKCGKIDSTIEREKEHIEKLKEYRQSLITEAVTKGLNPNTPMKDSGIEWIGEIPQGWKMGKMLYALEMPITDGPHETPQLFDTGIPFLSAEAVKNGKLNFALKRGYISEEFYYECCKKYIPKIHDIYMIKSGATTGNVAIVETNEIFQIWSPLAVFRANIRMNYKYLYHLLTSECIQKQIQLKWSYGTQQNIGMRVLEKITCLFPPLTEQKEIADHLDKKTAQIDKAIAKKESLIEKLQEYKKSLIFEAVTGKLEV